MNLSRANLSHWAKLLSTYFIGQGAMQVLQLITGFLIINWLTKDAYATFTLVMAIQGTTGVLVELGISSSLTALIGKKVEDSKALGRYIAACRYYRDRLLVLAAVILFVVFILVAPRYGWTGGLWVWLWLSVVMALVFQAWGAIYGPVFLLKGHLREMYQISICAGVWRLAMIVAAFFMGALTAPLALIYGALQSCIGGWASLNYALPFIEKPKPDEDLSQEKKEILSQAIPRAPSNVFYAFEGQVTIFLISVFGTMGNIAELGALSRLAMLFMIFKKTGGVLVTPYFSKLDLSYLKVRTVLIVAGACLFCVAVSGFAYLFPQPFLLVLGDGYQHLGFEVFLILTASAIRLITMVIFSICVARKYIFPWFSVVDLVPLITVMVAGMILLDLGQLRNMLYFAIAMALTKLASKLFILFVGLRRELRCDATTHA